MATLAISNELLSGLNRLERRSREKVSELAAMFQQMTAQELRESNGIHLERHTGQRDPRARTIRIDDNHRGIVFDVGDDSTFILTSIGTHQETDRWMASNTFRVNPATGALEIVNVTAIDEVIESTIGMAPEPNALFGHRRDRDFVQLGIDEALVPALRAFTDENQLQGLLGVLPTPQSDALIMLTGDDSVETIYAEVAGAINPATIDTSDIAAALDAPASRSTFRVMTDDDALAEMLARPLAQWRVYLHHSQEEAAYRPVYNGPARVTGGPGTGKTVVAMHRAAFLASRLEDEPGRPILFTTYTRNLAQAIEADLRLLGGSDLIDVTEVLNVDRLAYRIVQDHEGSAPRIASNDDLRELWDTVIGELDLDRRREFMMQEWEQIVLAQDIRSRDAYLTAKRAGRGVRLDRRARAAVWRGIEEFERHLIDRGLRTYLQLASTAAGYLTTRTVPPYQHVIVDEGQDLHEAQWRLLRAAVDPGPNDMFIVGDSHQRIYDRRSSLSQVGIKITGRSRRLRINYRTTHEILSWSLRLLGEGTFDDLDDGVESNDFAGYHSFLHGPQPALSAHRSSKGQYDALVEQVRQWINDGVDEQAIGITARTSNHFDSLERALAAAGIASCRLAGDRPRSGGVRVGTMHRFKGLEFRCVAVVDADSDTVPASWDVTPSSVDELQNRIDLQRERCLLYVACTRARDDLWIAWSGRPSPFLAGLVDDESPPSNASDQEV